jgi:hypothetical protein
MADDRDLAAADDATLRFGYRDTSFSTIRAINLKQCCSWRVGAPLSLEPIDVLANLRTTL